MADVSIAPEARIDLREIRRYSEQTFGRAATEVYVEGLRSAFQRAFDRPLAGKPEFDLWPDMRSVGYRSHRIYYRPLDNGVLIVRVMHHARDIRLAFDT